MFVGTALNPTMMRVTASLSRGIRQGVQEEAQGVQGVGGNLMGVLFVDLRDIGKMSVLREGLLRTGVLVVAEEAVPILLEEEQE